MQKPISSKALEQNLTLTQNRQILIPEEDQTFLALCGSVFGIQKRLVHFLKEIYHPFPNFEVVIRSLRQILLEDHSFYFKHELFEISQQRFLEYLEILLNYQTIQKQFKSSDADCLIHTLISYIPLVHQLKHPAKDQFVNSFTGLFKVFALQNVNVFCSNLTLFYTLWNNRLNQADLFYWLKTVLLQNLEFWSDNTQILVWYHQNIKIFKMDYGELFYLISHQFFEHLKIDILRSQNLNDLQKIPSHNEIATRLRQNTSKLNHPFDQIYYLIYLLNHPGMLSLYHHMIFDIDKIIRSLDSISDDQDFEKFINNLFNLFENLRDQFKDSIPDCLASLAKAIVRLKRQDFTSLFITKLIRFGFEFVDKIEVSQDWQLIYNMQHIKYIRIYLEIYENSTDVYKLVLSALIANLRLGGIFISDTDLFQKDISKLLNSPVQNHFKLVKQLCRIFPVYYNEIGAEGDLRDYSTKLDELTHTRDILIHFLRKQIHTESNNTHIELCAKIIDFWDKLSFEVLTEAYPEHVIQQAKVTAEDHETHQYIQHIKLAFQCSARDILDFNQDMLKKVGNLHSDGLSKKRVLYLVKIYQFLKMKYAFDSVELCEVLKKHLFIKEKDINNLKLALIKKDNAQTVHLIIMMMKQLKRIVLNPELSEGREEIYYKRHVAAGIPSMYGRYFESKFDALGLSLRLEQSASVFISNLIAQLPLEYVTAGTLKRIHKILELINEGLIADGVENETFASNLKMLKFSLSSGSFSIEQYKNIFQFMQEGVKEIINEFFFRNFDPVLKEIMPAMFRKQTIEKDYKLYYHKKTEQFYRDLISSAFIIQTLDQFIASVIDAINTMQQTLPENIINMVMHFDTEKLLTHLDEKNIRLDNQAFLGAKAYFLKQIISRNFPVPGGFVFTTELFRYREAFLKHNAMSREIDLLIRRNIRILEKKYPQRFGDPHNPLLLSVRSGAPLSMPGAMNTFLNIGMNDELTESLSQKPNFKWTAWDCYRRLLQSWGMAFGINRDVFDQLIIDFKNRYRVQLKTEFTAQQMREIAFAYKAVLADHQVCFEQDLYQQVRIALRNVIHSWDTERAILYRKQMEIADEWGTAVILQKMAFGNISLQSGSGVVFTHNPASKSSGIQLNGDYTLCSQGEDIVGGLVNTLPVSQSQFHTHKTEELENSLERKFPKIYERLQHYANLLLDSYGFNHQEIEFTFESPEAHDLHILQIRNQVIQKPVRLIRFKNTLKQHPVSQGTGIGQNVINGKVAFDMQDLIMLKKQFPNIPRILVRPDTVPDDMPMIFESEGLITGRGGISSHAAVTAVRLGKTGIVNCRSLKVFEIEKKCYFGEICIQTGDNLAIDPLSGYIWNRHFDTIQTEETIEK